jgi:hypothetical protein
LLSGRWRLEDQGRFSIFLADLDLMSMLTLVWQQTFEFPEREAVKELYPHFHHKTDKMGRPVYIERLGQLQVDELLKTTTMDRMLLYHVKEWETLIDWKIPACSKMAGTCISQTLTILDMKGLVIVSGLLVFSMYFSEAHMSSALCISVEPTCPFVSSTK